MISNKMQNELDWKDTVHNVSGYSKHMHREIVREEYLRSRAEDAYTLWLKTNNPYSIMYMYPNNPNDHEKFMFIQGYLSNKRGTRA
jgi:hypothetical protein